jgi:hypothetical protein
MSTWVRVAAVTGVGLLAGAGVAYAFGRRRSSPYADLPKPPSGSTAWELHTAHDPGYPFEAAVLHRDNWPTPGMWIDAGDTSGEWDPSQGFDSLVKALLGSALQMAGNDPKIAEAVGKDPNAPLGRALRKAVRESLIVPGGINDLLYGQTNANLAGGVDPGKPCVHGSTNAPCEDGIRDPNSTAVRYMMNTDGRGLNWLPRHADNLDRIAKGQPLLRTTSIKGLRLENSAGKQMLIWAPAYDLSLLAPDQAVPAIGYRTWSNGTSTLQPPPPIQALGVDLSGVEIPIGKAA